MSRINPWTEVLELTDKERLLMYLAQRLGPMTATKPHWGLWVGSHRDAKAGDLIRCGTQRTMHPFVIAWLAKIDGVGWGERYLLREFGGERTCWMSNEFVQPINNIPAFHLLEGHQFKAYVKTMKAFGRCDHYNDGKFAGIAFPDRHSSVATIGLRPHIFSSPSRAPDGQRYVIRPIRFVVAFTSKTRIRDIISLIKVHTPRGGDAWKPHAEIVNGVGGRTVFDVEPLEASP